MSSAFAQRSSAPSELATRRARPARLRLRSAVLRPRLRSAHPRLVLDAVTTSITRVDAQGYLSTSFTQSFAASRSISASGVFSHAMIDTSWSHVSQEMQN
jgi:hypothetical protein